MTTITRDVLAGIDAGGTTFKIGIAEPGGPLLAHTRIPTTTPDETVKRSIEAIRGLAAQVGGSVTAVGVAAFGPVDVDPASGNYGTILSTPKAGWSNFPLRQKLSTALGVPIRLDSDVNAALEAEMLRGAAVGTSSAAYVTVGTGIGGGICAKDRFAGRPKHPELGHIRVKRHPEDTDFAGTCPFHGDCLEGMASAPAIKARFGEPKDIPGSDERWDIPAFYLAQLTNALVLLFRLERIILGGGVMAAEGLLDRIRDRHAELMTGYVEDQPADQLIVLPSLGRDAGLYGALTVAERSA
ncbi:ROK family protein [Parvularcula lutaonensis]|uniref:fructokinase n=1 Tax=Parvularcula lutaonensis TaxID=491923 RepID=A0ABV7MDW2_9PROT|nr:ROK family protein [Parvularcula lutaonensis]GGY54037.1 fructokinase [Parvularcula lutaonensis]